VVGEKADQQRQHARADKDRDENEVPQRRARDDLAAARLLGRVGRGTVHRPHPVLVRRWLRRAFTNRHGLLLAIPNPDIGPAVPVRVVCGRAEPRRAAQARLARSRKREPMDCARLAARFDQPEGPCSMKSFFYLLGALLIVVAVVYFVVPADSLPSFMPGYEASVTRVHMKHGIASGAAGVVLCIVGWFAGRKG
jgi:hypothetical protein